MGLKNFKISTKNNFKNNSNFNNKQLKKLKQMKKLTILLIAIALIPSLVVAQTKSISEFQDKYREMDDATFVDISGSFFNFISNIANYVDEDDKDKKDVEAAGRILGAIKAMQVLKIPLNLISKSDISSLEHNMKREKYEDLMTIKEKDSYINILAQGSGSELKNVTFLIDQEDDFILFTFQGTFSMSDVSYLVKNKNSWD